jgi:hypothetical protein
MENELKEILKKTSEHLPFPISYACRKFLDEPPKDAWDEWMKLSRDILQPVLQYLSLLLLSDLVALEQKPAHLYHYIQDVLCRPPAGHYVRFLRETAKYYKENHLKSNLPELVDFLFKSEVETTLTEKREPLLGKLVDYRNLFAHGRIENERVIEQTTTIVRNLTIQFLKETSFLENYPLQLEDGTLLIGPDDKNFPRETRAAFLKAGENKTLMLHPLLLTSKDQDLLLLEDFDQRHQCLVYRGSRSFLQFKKKDLKKGVGKKLMEELNLLLKKVRSEEAVLANIEWESFRERASIITDRTLNLYKDMQKYIPRYYVPRPEWEGKDSIFEKFLDSDKTLLAVNGPQGSGKSALVSHLAFKYLEEGHAVLLINAQRFTFADVIWSGNPYPEYFSNELRYENPFEKGIFKSLLKKAPAGKKVILFIDAINEVDGIENKWNRFRAMALMLEWISGIAQPNLKVVLSFRLDVYEEFEYLQEHELPGNLMEISYEGDNQNKKWVTDLKPFDIGQAEQLYHKLQIIPELGMAPIMTWQEIKEALGEKLYDFIGNPLIFTILLKSRHQQKIIAVKDKEQLFFDYAERLTGAAQIKKYPWHKKVWGFIKNGNITPSEQFLADLVEKIAEEGGISCIIDKLNSKKKRDKRMLELINNPYGSSFIDLKEGGLIVEEKIDIVKGHEKAFTKRVTFVAELMTVAMGKVLNRIYRILKFRTSLLWSGIVLVLLPLVLGFVIFLISSELSALIKDYGFPLDIAVSYSRFLQKSYFIMTYAFIIAILPFILFLTHWRANKPPGISEVGLISRVFMKQKDLHTLDVVNKILLYQFLPMVFISISIILVTGEFNRMFIKLSPIISLILVAFIGLTPGGYYLIFRSSRISTTPKIIHMASKKYLNYYQSTGFRRKLFIDKMSLLWLTGLSFVLFFIVFSFNQERVISFPKAMNWRSFITENAAETHYIFWETMSADGKQVIFWLIPAFALFLYFLLKYIPFFSQRQMRYALKYPNFQRVKHPYFKSGSMIIIINIALLVFFVLFYNINDNRESETNKIALRNLQKIPAAKYKLDDSKRLIKLDLSDVKDEVVEKIFAPGLLKLKRLKLSPGSKLKIDLARFPSLNRFEGPGDSIINMNSRSKKNGFTLILYNPDNWIKNAKKHKSREFLIFGALGNVTSLVRIPEIFPYLHRLILDEKAARKTAKSFPGFRTNLVLKIESSDTPSLDWLTLRHCVYILHFPKPIDETTRNVEIINRLHMAANGLEPGVLRRAQSLEWLYLTFKKEVSPNFFEKLKKVVRTNLPNLKTLELVGTLKDGGINLKRVFTAQGKNQMNALLDRLIRNPDLIFNEEKEQRSN